MKKKNIYFHTVLKRIDVIKYVFVAYALVLCSWPSVIIEVFTRRYFGRRHFNFSVCLYIAGILISVPFAMAGYGESVMETIFKNFTWFGFIAAFLYCSFKRRQEIKEEKGTYDFRKFTLSSGIVNPWFFGIRPFGIEPTPRIISIYYEPILFTIIGAVLAFFNQHIGYVLIGCSYLYGAGWAARFYLGDQFIMDKIDEMICNEEMVNTFVDDLPPEQTRGFEVYGEKPRNPEFRRKLAESMIEDEPAVDVL